MFGQLRLSLFAQGSNVVFSIGLFLNVAQRSQLDLNILLTSLFDLRPGLIFNVQLASKVTAAEKPGTTCEIASSIGIVAQCFYSLDANVPKQVINRSVLTVPIGTLQVPNGFSYKAIGILFGTVWQVLQLRNLHVGSCAQLVVGFADIQQVF